MKRLSLTALFLAAALPVSAQSVIENEQMVVYEGQWVQTKLPQQNGALMFLSVPRGQKGEYFTIACEGSGAAMDRTVKLGFPAPLAAETTPVTLTVDGSARQATARFAGTTPDDAYTKGDIHSYVLDFASDAEEKAFFDAMRAGAQLEISGQTLPVSLRGATAALNGQPQYCK
ncbi:MAG: hypothetical protein ACU0DK_16410 [Pseudooceanicola sp.]